MGGRFTFIASYPPSLMIEFKNLLPPAPTLPACNIPGTQGQVQLGLFPNGNPIMTTGTFRIMGSGNTVSLIVIQHEINY